MTCYDDGEQPEFSAALEDVGSLLEWRWSRYSYGSTGLYLGIERTKVPVKVRVQPLYYSDHPSDQEGRWDLIMWPDGKATLCVHYWLTCRAILALGEEHYGGLNAEILGTPADVQPPEDLDTEPGRRPFQPLRIAEDGTTTTVDGQQVPKQPEGTFESLRGEGEPETLWSIFYNHEDCEYFMNRVGHERPPGVVVWNEGPYAGNDAKERTNELNATARQGRHYAALKEAYLLGKAAANEDKWAAITRALCGIEIAVSARAFDEVHSALERMVGADGVFRWPQEEA